MSEAAPDGAAFDLLRRGQGSGQGDNLREILGAVRAGIDMGAAGITGGTGGKDPGPDLFTPGGHDAVGGKKDRTAEGDKLLQLLPPGVAVVAGKVIVLFERRVVVSGKHLAVGIDIDAAAPGLLQQLLQIDQVVAGDQDRRVFSDADVHRSALWVAESGAMGPVQKGHHLHAVLAGFQGQRHQLVNRERAVQGCGQRLVDKVIYLQILLANILGMLGIGGHSLEPVDNGFTEGAQIFVFGRQYAHDSGLLQHRFPRAYGESGSVVQLCLWGGLSQHIPQGDHPADLFFEGSFIEIGVGDRHEETVQHLLVGLFKGVDGKVALDDNLRDPFQRVDQQVLKFGQLLLLTADAAGGTAGSPRRLLALKAKHAHRGSPPHFC